MEAREIAQRAGARQSGKSWIARCPAHDDRAPSLSIGEGHDGRVLLRCHAGCAVDAILQSLGLKVADLFESHAPPSRWRVSAPRPTAERIREALRAEALATRREITAKWHERCHHPCEYEPMRGRLLAAEINAIRRRVSVKLGVQLEPIGRPIYESAASMGCDRDPAWPTIYERALWLASIQLFGTPIEFGALRPPKAVVNLADFIARRDCRDLERDAFFLESQRHGAAPAIPFQDF